MGIQSVSFMHSMLFSHLCGNRATPGFNGNKFPCGGKSAHLNKMSNTSESLVELSAAYLYLGHGLCILLAF